MSKEVVVPETEVKRFMVDCLVKVGANADHATQLADVLVAGDSRGHYSHGMNRIDLYVKEIKTGLCVANGQPEVLQDSPATAWVDGKNVTGPVVANFCMDLAIKKAKQIGVGWVVAKRSNHFGIVGWYSMKAANEGLIGLAFTNTSPIMFPTRSKQIAMGTSPLSVAAPGTNGDQFVLDMASTTVALGKVEMALRKGENNIPHGWGADRNGQVTTDPQQVMDGGGLLPLAGLESTGGYKGFGIATAVEILCGVAAGGNWGPNIRNWQTMPDKQANYSQCFIAVDPKCFAPGFEGRTQEMMDTMRSLEPMDPAKPVLVAGDPEREHMKLCEKLGGIPYHPNQIKYADDLAAQLGVKPLKPLT